MTDPYKVLGVSPNATDEEVRAAYRELAKKYHPDNYANNPLSDLANEKMSEINEAYDTIMNMRRGKSSSGSSSYSGSGGGRSQFADIRRLINANRIVEAEELLNGVPEGSRNAEWYFLKGSVFYARGWLNEATNYFSRAVSMDPQNTEYRAALNQISYQRNTGFNTQGNYQTMNNNGGCSGCDVCSSLICADCCCECMGGDLIRCC